MSDLIAIVAFVAAVVFVFVSLSKLINAKFSAYYAVMLGMGGLVLIDITKYYYLNLGQNEWIGDDHYKNVSILIIISCLTFFASYFFFNGKIKKNRKQLFYKKRRGNFTRLVKFFILPTSLAYTLMNDGSGYASLIGGCVKGFVVALLIYGLIENDRFAMIVSVISLLVGVDDSSRRAYIAIFVPSIVVITDLVKKRFGFIPLKSKLVFAILLLSIFVFLNAIRSTNDFGEGFDPNDKVSNTLSYISKLRSVDTFYNTSFLVEKFPVPWDFYYGETYFSVLAAPIPRSIWEDKPVGLGAPLGLMNRYGYKGKFDIEMWGDANQFSLSPGFVGEAYANFGYIGVLVLSILLGFVTAFFDKKVVSEGLSPRTIPWLMFLSTFVLIHRGDFYVSVNYQLFMFIAVFIFYRNAYSRYTMRRA